MPGSSISAVARRYGISPSLVFGWKHMHEAGALAGLEVDERIVPETGPKDLLAKFRGLEGLLCKKTMDAEILREGIELARATGLLLPRSSSGKGWFPMRRVAAAFGVSRSALVDAVKRAEAPVAPAEEVQHVPRAAPGDEELLGRTRPQSRV